MLAYKYLDIKGAEKTINNKSVLLKCPTEFEDKNDGLFFDNDKEYNKAFELYVNYYLFQEFISGRAKANTSYLKMVKKNAEIATANAKKSHIFRKQLDLAMIYVLALKISKKNDREFRNQFKTIMGNVLHKMRESTLVSCFGSSFDSDYLWSEYAEDHKGVCMEYEVEGDEYRKVEYKKELPVFQLTRLLEIYFGHQICKKEIDTTNKSFWFALDPIFTKSINYVKEEEIRCVFSKNNAPKEIHESNGLMLLEMPLPKRIFIGVETSDELEKKIRNAYPGVNIEKMKILDIKKRKLVSYQD